jgi:DNA polymerase III alpha subunit (gram-positive type)
LIKPTTGVGTIVFDLETNGLLHDATRIHCVALHWGDNNRTEAFNDEPYGDGTYCIKEDAPMGGHYSITTALGYLECADVIVGHNIIGFDIPIIKKLYSWFEPRGTIIDTLLLSRLYHPNLLDIDKKHAWKHMPLQLYGRHSLEAYGYRLGEYKGNFGKTTDWQEWTQEMEDYCKQDVAVTTKLCNHFHKYLIGSY